MRTRKTGRCDLSDESKRKNDHLYGFMEILEPTGQYFDETIGPTITTYPPAAAHGVTNIEDLKCTISHKE